MPTNPTKIATRSNIQSLFYIGANNDLPIYQRQRIVYFNTLIIALPVVYLLFVLSDIRSYFHPVATWNFDQYSFFIFILVCGICLFLNHLEKQELAKLIFLIVWPLIQHIIPIIIQHTPTDYYIAFPIGLIFHSLMIQVIYSSKYAPWKFYIFMAANFFLTFNFLSVLQYFDVNEGSELRQLAGETIYTSVVMLYWLLFNFVILYIMRVIENHMVQISTSSELVEKQKAELEETLDRLKASHEIVIQSEKMASLGVFTAGIAHELNNPMNFIGSGTEILFDKLNKIKKLIEQGKKDLIPEIENLTQAQEAIKIGVEKSTKIINSLKNYARTDDEDFKAQNVIQCIEEAIILIPKKLKNKVKLTTDLPQKLMVNGSHNKLTQVFVNLIQNAIDACDKGTPIQVVAFVEKNMAIMEVIDHGPGIKRKDRSKIFDPFYTTKKIGEGTGLGLYIVHDIIKDHGGIIDFKTKMKSGTRFIINLPIYEKD